MFRRLKEMFRPDLEPMNVIKIHKDNILFNYGLLQGLHPEGAIFPVLKSNAYGHGLQEVLRIIRRLPVPYVVVDSVPEYYIVKQNSHHNVLLLGETLPVNYGELDFTRVTPCIWSLGVLEKLLRMNKEIKVHLFLNTGMNREGLDKSQLKIFLEKIKNHKRGKNIVIEGVLSHFAQADTPGSEALDWQIKTFKKLHEIVLDYGHQPIYRHIGNGPGTLKMEDGFFNAWRPGLALFGYNPLLPEDEAYSTAQTLRPAMTITTRVVAVQHIKKGDTVGYNNMRSAVEDSIVITVPFGYTEGMMRSMSNKIFARFGRTFLSQVGSVCMNLCCFVVPKEAGTIEIGDVVELISPKKDAFNSIKAWAQAADTIPYEIVVGINAGLRREIDID